MEKRLDDIINQTLDQTGVVGAMIIDSDGLSLASSGKTGSFLGGPITELTSLASKLCENKNPAIVLETDNCNLLIKRDGIVTAAVYRQVS